MHGRPQRGSEPSGLARVLVVTISLPIATKTCFGTTSYAAIIDEAIAWEAQKNAAATAAAATAAHVAEENNNEDDDENL